MFSYLAVKSIHGQWIACRLMPIRYWLSIIPVVIFLSHSVAAQSCPPTTGLSATQTVVDGKNAVVIDWDANPGASRYLVYFRSVGNEKYTQKKTNSNSKTIVGLPPDTQFEVKIRTFCPGSNHFTSPLIFISGNAGVSCSYPSNLSASSETIGGHHSTVFDWDPEPEAKYYVVFYRLQGTSRFRQRAVVQDSLRVNNLDLGSIYEWKVRTICSWDQSFWNPEDSPLEEVTTQDTGMFCSLTDNLSFSNTSLSGYNATDLTWDNIPGAAGYFLQYRINGSGTPWNSVTLAGDSPHNIAGLSPDSLYDIRVQTLCNLGPRIRSEDPLNSSQNFDFVNGSFTSSNLGITCEAPQNVRQTGETFVGGNYQSTFSWDPVPGVDHYQVRYFLGGRVVTYITTTNTSVIMSQLDPEYYLFTVQSICTADGSVESAWSPIIKFTPSLNCVEPTGLSANPSTSSGFNVADLTWGAVADALSYEIRYRPVGTANWQFETSTISNHRIEYLQARTDYEWQVRSICSADGEIGSNYSQINNFTTLNGQDCDTPKNLRSRVIRNFALLRWNNVPRSISYHVQVRIFGDTEWNSFTSNSFITILTGLSPNTIYEWRVRSVCSQSPLFISPYASVETFTTGGGGSFFGGRTSSASSSSLTLEPYSEGLNPGRPTVSPNPARDQVYISPTGFEILHAVSVYNSSGYQIKNLPNSSQGDMSISLDKLPPGIYFLRTTTDRGTYTSKLIVQ